MTTRRRFLELLAALGVTAALPLSFRSGPTTADLRAVVSGVDSAYRADWTTIFITGRNQFGEVVTESVRVPRNGTRAIITEEMQSVSSVRVIAPTEEAWADPGRQ